MDCGMILKNRAADSAKCMQKKRGVNGDESEHCQVLLAKWHVTELVVTFAVPSSQKSSSF